MPCRDRFRAAQLPFALARLKWLRLARRHRNTPLAFRDERGALILLTAHRAPVGRTTATPWRVTWFSEAEEPCGHAFAVTHADAVLVARDYGALSTTVLPLLPLATSR